MQRVEQYINRIMETADLARRDRKRVRGELESHIQELFRAGELSGLTEMEAMNMIENEFGNPEKMGKMIAAAKGKFRTYLKKQTRKVPITVAAALVIALTVRAVAFEAFVVTSDAVSPVIPNSSRVLVNKLSTDFETNDVIFFRSDREAKVGIIENIDKSRGGFIVSRNDEENTFVPSDKIVGRAVFIYFCSL